jgi:hypothetical protein
MLRGSKGLAPPPNDAGQGGAEWPTPAIFKLRHYGKRGSLAGRLRFVRYASIHFSAR